MSNYEFWDELGKIFNAVVAYQEKTIEFNKRFINPWIRLGNVFDKQDRNKEAVSAYQKAIEIDPENAQNWYELGNVYFKMASYEEAIDAFNRAIELNPNFGWSYNNLALTLVTQGKHVQALPLYRKSIELLDDDKDKAVAWNRLGNVYRKLNEYTLAVEAFQKADDLDHENAGFRDDLDEVPEAPTVIDIPAEIDTQSATVTLDPIQLIIADSQATEAAPERPVTMSESVDASTEVPTQPVLMEAEQESVAEVSQPEAAAAAENPVPEMQMANEATEIVQTSGDVVAGAPVKTEAASELAAVADEVTEQSDLTATGQAAEESASNTGLVPNEEPEAAEKVVQPTEAGIISEETISVIVQTTIETFTETVAVPDTSTETSDVALTVDAPEKPIEEPVLPPEEAPIEVVDQAPEAKAVETESTAVTEAPAVTVDSTTESVDAVAERTAPEVEVTASDAETTEPEVVAVEAETSNGAEPMAQSEEELVIEAAGPVVEEIAEAQEDSQANTAETSEHVAYEEFLKDNNEPIMMVEPEDDQEETESEVREASQEPVATIGPSGDLQIEMDTKNAHVWNELGNVYFNTGAFDDAIIAYSKAIELDRWFAWPYSNLALAYVQKSRFAEAILLYQRSIELFTGEKDKAISWNRLGNVYRRMNDYENAISSYQRADDLDPDNTTLSMQSRFSLLGSYAVEPKPSYAA